MPHTAELRFQIGVPITLYTATILASIVDIFAMYQGSSKGSGAVIGWGTGAAPSEADMLVDADEAFESSSGNEGVVCQDPSDPEGGMIIAIAHLSKEDGSLQWSRALDMDSVLRR